MNTDQHNDNLLHDFLRSNDEADRCAVCGKVLHNEPDEFCSDECREYDEAANERAADYYRSYVNLNNQNNGN